MKKITLIIFTVFLLAGCTNTFDENAQEELDANEIEAREKKDTPAPTEEVAIELVTLQENPKGYYLQALDRIDMALTKLEDSYSNGSTAALTAGETESLKRWDKALNEIYGVLKEQLPPEEMEQLRQKQREWIEFRDLKADEAAAEFAGGTLENVTHLTTQRQLTKERCYFLVNAYLTEKGQTH